MSLRTALVDRARRIRETRSVTVRVEGGSRMVQSAGPWFPARLEMSPAPEVEGAGPDGGPLRTVPAPQLIFQPFEDPDDAPDNSDRIEVASNELGTHMWRVIGDPEIWRKKRKVVGYRVNLERVDEPGLP